MQYVIHCYDICIIMLFMFCAFRTPLHWAAAAGQTDAVTTLLELNANPIAVDAEGNTPLEYAQKAGHQGTHIINIFLNIF